jgi:hypothetical protein
MNQTKPPLTFRQRIVDGLRCDSCRRYRRGLALVLLVSLAFWLSGRWG